MDAFRKAEMERKPIMAKRKCRMTEHELDVHKQAVALRKMTDEQLVEAWTNRESVSQPREGTSEDKALKVPTKLDTLLHELADGSVKGVGKVTTEKLIEYCLEKGYSRFGIREV